MSAVPPQYKGSQWATLPNAITLLRLALVIPIAVFIVQDIQPVLTVVLLILFGASDWIDGYLARKLDQTSLVGAILDPIADRLGVGAVVVVLVLAGHLHLGIIVAIAVVDVALLIAYLVTHSLRMPSVSLLGKIRTTVLMIGLALTSLSLLPTFEALISVGSTLCGVGAGLHAIAGIGYLRRLAHCSHDRRTTSV